jgi:hypothetical protein
MNLPQYTGIMFSFVYIFVFMVIEPFTHRYSIYIIPFKRHVKIFEIIFGLFIIDVMAALIVYIIGGAIIEHALTANLWYDFIFARVNNGLDAARVSTYIMIPTMFFIAYVLVRNEWKALAFALYMPAIHETFWEIFYYVQYWQYFQTSAIWVEYLSFAFMLCTLLFVPIYKYRKWMPLTTVGIFFYSLWWYMQEGFRVTVSVVTPTLWVPGKLDTTIWYGDLGVNLIEVCSWVLVFILMIIDINAIRIGAKSDTHSHKSRLIKHQHQ